MTGKTSADIASEGIARTFQNVQLFAELTLIENVLVGLHHTYQATFAEVALGLPRIRREEKAARERAMSLLHFVGLADLANEEARNLPYGKQRLVEIALALATKPRILLLDEPAAGIPAGESAELFSVIAGLPRDVTILFIEHDMGLVFRFAERISVLVGGRVLTEGTPAEIAADPRVREVYLGEAQHG